MWIGERITENGVGNGISIVLLINIISRVPSDLYTLYEKFMGGKKLAQAGLAGLIILAVNSCSSSLCCSSSERRKTNCGTVF